MDRRDVLFTNSIIILCTIGGIMVLFLLLVSVFFAINKHRRYQMEFYEIPDSGKPSISLADLLADPSIPQLRHSDIKFQKEIGRGGNSIVWSATWNSRKVAVKQMLLTDMTEDNVADFCREIKILRYAKARGLEMYAMVWRLR
jgi:hypothetical protein